MKLTSWLVGVTGILTSLTGYAQGYPLRTVQVISPVQSGSAGDASLRILTAKLSENVGQQFFVDNYPGAAGMIGLDKLAKANPDGYSIGGVSDSTLTYVPILQKRVAFDALGVWNRSAWWQ